MMLKDYYVSYEVNEPDTDEYFFCGGQNIAAVDRDDAIDQVKAMFGKFGNVKIKDVEQISDDEV